MLSVHTRSYFAATSGIQIRAHFLLVVREQVERKWVRDPPPLHRLG
jgi:hypothetical protein